MNIWITMAAAGVLTFLIRLSFIFLMDRIRMPVWFTRALRFVPLAVLSAIIVPSILERGGSIDLSLKNPQIYAGIAAILVAWKTKNVVLTIVVGMAALLLLQALVPGMRP